MASTAAWYEDNGTATGSPAQGTTRTATSNVNWKSVDDTTTAYTSAVIVAGQNSYSKYQFVQFTGTFNQISAGLFAHTSGTLGSGLTLMSNVTSTYATPATSAITGTNISTPIAISSGAAVNFSTVGPQGASPTSTLTAAGYTQYLQTQLQTTTSAASGDIGSQTLTFQWNEQ